jgi:hypothetical protein
MKMKKIIAREFLIFLGAILLFLVMYFSWFQKKESLQKEINNSQFAYEKVENITFKFEPVISLELLWNLYLNDNEVKKNINNRDLSIIQKFPELNTYLKSNVLLDFIRTKEAAKYDSKIEFYSKFPEFGFDDNGYHRNIKTSSFNELKKIQEQNNDLKIKYSVFQDFSEKDIILTLAALIFSIFFLIRYLFYAVKWSIIQLK